MGGYDGRSVNDIVGGGSDDEVARRICTGLEDDDWVCCGDFSRETGAITVSRRIANSVAFFPVPIWTAATHALAAASLAVRGRRGTR